MKNMGPGSKQSILVIQVQRTMSVSQEKQERNKTQTLTRAAASNYGFLGVTPWMRPLMGSKMIHSPTDQKAVS